MEVNNIASGEEEIIVKRQWASVIAGLVFLVIVGLISRLAFGTFKYGLLGPCIPMLYLGVSSIKNRVSVLRLKGQRGKYSRDSSAIYVGVGILVSVAIDIVVLLTPSLSERFLPF
jgi:hypothetical protein